MSNAIELELPSTVRIHSVVNFSRIQKYVGQVEGQRKEQLALVIIKGIGSWENLEQVVDKGKEQIFSKIERIYSGIRYLGGKKKLGECKGGNWGI